MAHVMCFTIIPQFQQDKKWNIQTLLPRVGIHPPASFCLDMAVDREDHLDIHAHNAVGIEPCIALEGEVAVRAAHRVEDIDLK